MLDTRLGTEYDDSWKGELKVKNQFAKSRPKENPYEVWQNGSGWTWNVLKKWQADDNKPFARWFCFVTSPYCPEGEYGDTYVADIKGHAVLVKSNHPVAA